MPPRGAQQSNCLGQSELLAREAADKAATADFTPAFKPAIDAEQFAPGRQPGGLTFQQPPEHDAVARQQSARDMLHRFAVALCSNSSVQCPAASILHPERSNAPAPSSVRASPPFA